jgi:VanZ family protein
MIDTLLHLILYGVLSFIPMILFKSRKNAFLLSLAMTPIGYLFETMHTFVTEENFSAINVLANNIGVLAGIATGFIVRLKCHFSHE